MRASMPRCTRPTRAVLATLLLVSTPSWLVAQAQAGNAAPPVEDPITAERYMTPPAVVEKLVTTQRDLNVTFGALNPGSRTWHARTTSDGLPALSLLGKPYHNLGGFQVDRAASRSRRLTTRSDAGLELRNWETGEVVTVDVPKGARVGPTAWSPDGETVAFMALFDDATHIYTADPSNGRTRQITRTPVLATHVTSIEWTADSRSIVTVLMPNGRGAEPEPPTVALNPMIKVNERTKLRTRTYASLLATPHERELLRYFSTGQLAVIDVRSRKVQAIGAPAMIRSVSVSPDGMQFRVNALEEPFSYVVPVSQFGNRERVVDASGTELAELSVRELTNGTPIDSVPTRPVASAGRGAASDTSRRSFQWHPTAPGLLFAQRSSAPRGAANGTPQAAGADSAAGSRRADRLVHWAPPYDSTSSTVLYETRNRITAARFSDDASMLFVSETGTGGATEVAVMVNDPSTKYTLLSPSKADRDSAAAASPAPRGRASAPSLVTAPGRRGTPSVVVSTDGQYVFLEGSTPDTTPDRAAKVWLDRIAIRTGDRSRLYEGGGTMAESIVSLLDNDATRVLVTRESPTMPPQSYAVTIANGEARQLTNNTDLTPEVTLAIKRTVTATRVDGRTFTVRVTLPADYKEGTRLPAMFWFYPREYQDQEAYDQATGTNRNAGRFPRFSPRSMAYLTTQGYAVVEPDAPIFAANGLPANDNYEADLRNDLLATIDALDTLAIIDRHRLAIGGHSYGAFSAVNAMVHTPFFKAGIAGDGNYNRTLTPNGFQSERRDLWQGRNTYLSMSPFFFADKLNGALLLYHSTDDQNVGTAPINSERLFHALQGLGKDVSLYMYPYEDHGPIARETVLDQWARWVAWLDKYVKGTGSKGPVTLQDAQQ